ncbi:MAG: hypothetical protein WKF91_01775 [Segetibacter sp.]
MEQITTVSKSMYEKRWLALALICTAQFLVIMDTSIIGVALPAIKTDLVILKTACNGYLTLM